MLTALALFCLYLACLAFYQAAPKRTAFASIKGNVIYQRLTRAVACGFCLIALALLIALAGFERGFPIWLGLFMLAGVTSLLIAGLFPKWHLKSAYVVAAFCGLSGVFMSPGVAA